MTVPERWKDGLESDTPPAPYATDGTDFRGAVRYHYGVALKKFLKFFPVFLLLWVQLFVFHLEYLLPVAIVGMFGMLWTLFLLADRLSFTRKCSKVFRTYPLEFRTPVEKYGMESTHTLFLRFGDQGGTLHPACEARAGASSVACRHHGRRPVRRRRALRRRDHRAGQR